VSGASSSATQTARWSTSSATADRQDQLILGTGYVSPADIRTRHDLDGSHVPRLRLAGPPTSWPPPAPSSATAFDKDGQEPDGATGVLSLYHGDHKVGEGRIKTQLGAFAIAGAGPYVSRQDGEPVTQDYPGASPHTFSGGTIDRVAIDVSGEPYLDLEREAALMMMRE
jgi:hypothetical protein